MQKQKPLLSIIVPVFNEQKRLYHLTEICNYFSKHLPGKHEIIFVNDGSTDNTLKELQVYQKKYSFQILSYPYNRGKGFAVRQGMLMANGEYRLFLDIDLSTSPAEWENTKKYLSKSEVVIGIRRSEQSQVLVHQSWLRENMGRVFTWLSQTILATPVRDFTCGFKIFSRDASAEIFSRSRIDRWGFDSEILYLAHKLGYQIREVPITWKNDQNTRVHLVRDAFSSLIELLTIRYYSFLGSYTRTLT